MEVKGLETKRRAGLCTLSGGHAAYSKSYDCCEPVRNDDRQSTGLTCF